ncbi:hypothetical protein ASE40_07030 [Flavobacterium sp. Root935]|uniref:hypothetical protein n=1 Tax=unclassified Flavobacterium TaxID=196869 RepID=UPI00070A120D|nr:MULTISPECIES: hypothetical protein [unclassified Flavobacterium]KRD61290.1 hypothetical protein ASE40_07030 [Flavobacterium sp. Root935]MDQ1166480.1 hypothetical protein [Flavobacterium sp. SORGH_AS_0622]
MENIFNQENLEDIQKMIEDKLSSVPGELILCGAVGALLLSSYLNKTGHTQAGSVIGKLSIPIIGIGIAKYQDVLKSAVQSISKAESASDSQQTE